MMKKLSKINKYSNLFDIYKKLLTDKKTEIFEQYYFEDMQLSEIATKNNINKSTVHITIKRIEKQLDKLEKELQVYKKLNNISKKYKIDFEKLLNEYNS